MPADRTLEGANGMPGIVSGEQVTRKRAMMWWLFHARGGKQVATGGGDGVVRLWSITDGSSIRELTGHACPVFSTAFHPDGTHLLSGDRGDQKIKQWDYAAGKQIREFDAKDLSNYKGGTDINAESPPTPANPNARRATASRRRARFLNPSHSPAPTATATATSLARRGASFAPAFRRGMRPS